MGKSNVTHQYRGQQNVFSGLNKKFALQQHHSQNPFSKQHRHYLWMCVDSNSFGRAFIRTGLSGGALQSHNGLDPNENKYIWYLEIQGLSPVCHTGWTNVSIESKKWNSLSALEQHNSRFLHCSRSVCTSSRLCITREYVNIKANNLTSIWLRQYSGYLNCHMKAFIWLR